MTDIPRRPTTTVLVGGIPVGSEHPVVVQSMTNTDTADPDATAIQVAQLAHAGSELVRITVNNDAAAQAVPEIRAKLDRARRGRPARRRLPLQRPPAAHEVSRCGRALAKYRINPGNVGTQAPRRELRHDHRGRDREREAGAHRRELGLARPAAADRDDGRQRAPARAGRQPRGDDRGDARVGAALRPTGRGGRPAARPHHLSAPRSPACRTSSRSTRGSAERCDYPLHLGLTEAGMGAKGIITSTRGSRHPPAARASATRFACRSPPSPAATARRRCRSRSRCCSRSACAPSCRR